MQSLAKHTIAPLIMQMAASHVFHNIVQQPSLCAFTATICFVNLPLALSALMYRICGWEGVLFNETWATTSTMLQSLYFYGYESRPRDTKSGASITMIVFVVVFMNEFTMFGGDWFGHQIVVAMNLFFCMRTLIGIAETSVGDKIATMWSALVVIEFCTMSAIPLITIWTTNGAIGWFVGVFVICVPIAFPTSNRLVLPSRASEGVLLLAPVKVMYALADAPAAD